MKRDLSSRSLVAQLGRLSKSKAPRLGARLRPGYLVRWQAENARTDWTGPRTSRHDYPRHGHEPGAGETKQLINARSRNAISATRLAHPSNAWSACLVPFLLVSRDSWARSNASSTCIFFLFSLSFFFSNYNDWSIKLNWIRGGEVRSNLSFYRCCLIYSTIRLKLNLER